MSAIVTEEGRKAWPDFIREDFEANRLQRPRRHAAPVRNGSCACLGNPAGAWRADRISSARPGLLGPP